MNASQGKRQLKRKFIQHQIRPADNVKNFFVLFKISISWEKIQKRNRKQVIAILMKVKLQKVLISIWVTKM